MMRTRTLISTLACLAFAATALAAGGGGFTMNVLVDGAARPEYFHDGTPYVEAIRGASFSLRLTNPTPYRVAVALSVDGLNTIDARHTGARDARKWIIEPYDSIVISGWQTSDEVARAFYFIGERHSYGAALGQTQNLGVIEAVFFRERRQHAAESTPPSRWWGKSESNSDSGAGAAPPPAAAPKTQSEGLSDDYAATGMGHRERHEVETVDMDLESDPIASARIRYEFRTQLVKMGILPPVPSASPLERREHARGFSPYCPEPR